MKRNIEFRGFQEHETVKERIDRLISKLERHTRAFSAEAVYLRLIVEHNSVRSLYDISLTLDLPSKTLASKVEQHDMQAGIRGAFSEIERQLERYKADVRREHWKRPERRDEARTMKTRAASSVAAESKRDVLFSLVTPYLKRLDHFVRHLIAYSVAMGDLVDSDLTPQDVVDGTLLRAYREFLTRRTIPDVKNWLIRLAIDQLDDDVTRLKTERASTVHIEENVPETAPTQEVSTLGDEILDFYQPDEDLKLEDLIPDIDTPTPEDAVEAKDLRRIVNRALTRDHVSTKVHN